MGLKTKSVVDRKGLRQFGFIMSGAIIFFFFFFVPWLLELTASCWPWVVAGVLFLFSLFRPDYLRPVYVQWMRLANVLGKFNAFIILGLVFCLLVFPYSIALRLMGKDFMSRSWDKQCSSYRVPSRKLVKIDFERPF